MAICSESVAMPVRQAPSLSEAEDVGERRAVRRMAEIIK